MAHKTVTDLEVYYIASACDITIDAEIGFAQKGVSALYLNGTLVQQFTDSFSKELSVKNGDAVKLFTTVSDINQSVNHTSVDVKISGGVQDLIDPHKEEADEGDIVFYDLSYYIVQSS